LRVSVLESGSWGTALAVSLLKNGHEVTLHSVYEKRSDELKSMGENRYLPGVKLPEDMRYSDGFSELSHADAVVFATPSYALRTTAAAVRGYIPDKTVIVSASKGIEAKTTLRLSQIIEEELGGYDRIVALSGPSHAEEVGLGMPTGCVAASVSFTSAQFVQDIFMSPDLRIYTSSDIIGVELCGALKNIIAITVGICMGMKHGDNTMAMLMTRGLNEIAALGVALGGRKETFAGLAGIGDLIVTCTSRHSRNRRAGFYIGEGLSSSEALKKVGATVEGYYAVLAAMELSDKTGVEMPITSELYRILYEDKDPKLASVDLMNRAKKDEHSDLWL
jgi:glycerol-3-phosphate dehydrogenase (NAD(P)+)